MPEQKTLYPINYLGKTYNTTIHKDLTDDEYEAVVDGIRALPPLEEVEAQMKAFSEGGSRLDRIYAYFFKATAYKVRLIYNNWSIDEALEHKPLMEFFAGKVADNKKVYPDTMPLHKKIETAFRLCGFRTCSKPSNFPLKAIDDLLAAYCPEGGTYLDYSSGWGVRMLAALRKGLNYVGIDPNHELVSRLVACARMFGQVSGTGHAEIHCTGSEEFMRHLEGRVDFAFSSPPYFSLEDYRIGEKQSYREGTSYDSWISDYARPTVKNCFRYVKPGGVFAFNIKNNTKYIPYDMEGDWLKLTLDAGFEELATVPLSNITRVSGHRHDGQDNTMLKHDNDELIRLFRRP